MNKVEVLVIYQEWGNVFNVTFSGLGEEEAFPQVITFLKAVNTTNGMKTRAILLNDNGRYVPLMLYQNQLLSVEHYTL